MSQSKQLRLRYRENQTMSDMAMRIKIISEPDGWMWQQRLNPIIEEGQASCLGGREYEFHSYSDGCAFQIACDDLGLRYEVVVESDD